MNISDKNIDRMIMLVRCLLIENFYAAEDLEEAELVTRLSKNLEMQGSDADLTEALNYLAGKYEI